MQRPRDGRTSLGRAGFEPAYRDAEQIYSLSPLTTRPPTHGVETALFVPRQGSARLYAAPPLSSAGEQSTELALSRRQLPISLAAPNGRRRSEHPNIDRLRRLVYKP